MGLKKHYHWLLITFVIYPILDIILGQLNINLPIIRYVIYSLGTFYIVKLYLASSKNTAHLSNLSRILLSFLLVWISIRFLLSIAEIFRPDKNYISLKSTLSGEFILFFSFYFVNITIPLNYFRLFLKAGYVLLIIFLIIAIPLSGFFTANILNQAELFVRYFYLGSMFLLLLSPYQRTKVNLFVMLGFLLSLFFMLVLARRNVVLYLLSGLFFLSLAILFSKSQLLKIRKTLLLVRTILLAIPIFVAIVALQLNFDLFFERADTGMESRELVIKEFNDDFDTNKIDWFIGRGPQGAFKSKSLGDDVTNMRLGIENGYYLYILQKGLLFLIPFCLLSIAGIFSGLFRSKNHLSKAAAILIIINLIDMIGFGLPFLGLKYINLLIAFGFCLSPKIRNMEDIEIQELIRL